MSETRTARIDRIGKARFRATNERGATIDIGEGTDSDFTPVELLLVALAGCTAIDVDYITGKRATPQRLSVSVTAEKVRDEGGNHLTDIVLSFEVAFPDGPDGDAAREVLPSAVQKSHDRLCTVGRTVQLGTPVEVRL